MSVPMATWTVRGSSNSAAAAEQAQLLKGEAGGQQAPAHGLAQAQVLVGPPGDGGVDELPGLPGHAELAAAQDLVHVLGGAAHHGDLGVVDDAGPVQGQAGEEMPAHQVDDDGIQAHLDGVRPHAQEDLAAVSPGRHPGRRHLPQGLARQDIGEPVHEIPQAAATLPRPAEVGPAHLGVTLRQTISLDALQRKGFDLFHLMITSRKDGKAVASSQ